MPIRKRLAAAEVKFSEEDFVDSKYYPARDKAKVANHFVKFVRAGMPENMFPEWFYSHLMNMFHHIAHYNKNGFYGYWFCSTMRKALFLSNVAEAPIYGSPEHTFSDVEEALKRWVRENDLVNLWDTRAKEETRQREVAERDRLLQKHPL